jgi:hypothetical protein
MIAVWVRAAVAALFAVVWLGYFSAQAEPAKVNVSVYVLSLGKLDLDRANVPADFYLTFDCDGQCPAFDFELMNGRISGLSKVDDLPNRKMYRIYAELRPTVDLRRFPFDRQTISIVIEDKGLEKNALVYIADLKKTGFDSDISLPGWTLGQWSASVADQNYDVLEEYYSRYRFSVEVSKPLLNAFLKTLMPIVFIFLIVTFSYVIPVEKTDNRLSAATASLIGSVMFHVAITNQNPPLGYMTFADKIMLIVYGFLFLTIAYNVFVYELVQRKQEERARALHQSVRFKVIVGAPLTFALLFWILRQT